MTSASDVIRLLGIPCRKVSESWWVSKALREFLGLSRELKVSFKDVSMVFRRFRWVSRGFSRVSGGFTGVAEKFQGVAGVYIWVS